MLRLIRRAITTNHEFLDFAGVAGQAEDDMLAANELLVYPNEGEEAVRVFVEPASEKPRYCPDEHVKVTTGVNPVTFSPDRGDKKLVMARMHIGIGDGRQVKPVIVTMHRPGETPADDEVIQIDEEHFISGLRHLFTAGELDSDAAVSVCKLVAAMSGGDNGGPCDEIINKARLVVARQPHAPEIPSFRFMWEIKLYKVTAPPAESYKTIRLPDGTFVKVTAWHDEPARFPLCIEEADEPTTYDPLEAEEIQP